ncbi:hypothetical protein CK203_055125 [Vitis vinifera]|uniref:Uncharacterized protein n=1 Tax=Vitis vinifera TaxID=29760 RepID=A0A438GUG9_VITVI|nr:hypothetical protein CK203_055125 [Vitis vinifera]
MTQSSTWPLASNEVNWYATYWKYCLKNATMNLPLQKTTPAAILLHEVAASDTMKDVAERMLKRGPELLIARNDLGETPIFCAARYGQN